MTSRTRPLWPRKVWGDIAHLAYGKALRDRSKYGPVTVYGTNGPIGHTERRLGDGPTVVIGRKGAYRGVHYAPGPFWVIDTAFFVMLTDGIDMKWAYYELLTHNINSMDSGSAIPSTSRKDFYALPVRVPSPREQHHIVSILDVLNDKIDSNQRLATLLEETAALIFRARFVDFVGCDEFEESEIGRAPRQWIMTSAGNVLKVVGGGTPSTGESRYWQGGTHCWATPKDLASSRSSVLLDTARHITDDGVSRISSKLLPARTVLLSSRAPIGYTAISFVPVAVNQGFIAIPPTDGVPSEFVLFWLRAHMDAIKAAAGGTTFAEISKRQFRSLPICLPPGEKLDEFAHIVRPMIDHMATNESEVRTLTHLRDALLPKLISGEIRLPDTSDAEEVIGPAAAQLAGASR